ncbi:unnamed protein product [Rhodiola kirilowii]
MENLRFRVHFADRGILTASQKKERLNRSWLLLKPDLKTIADLANYLARLFRLHHSCPSGILLFIDGFVLPQFESTSIVKDKDLICVKRKRGVVHDIVELCNGSDFGEEEGGLKRLGLGANKLLLADEEFEKEIGGYQSEEEGEDGMDELSDESLQGAIQKPISKKRKANRKLKSPKRTNKKLKAELRKSTDEKVENDTHQNKKLLTEISKSSVKDVEDHRRLEKATHDQLSFKALKAPSKKSMPPNGDSTPTKMSNSERHTRSKINSESVQRDNRHTKPQENGGCSQDKCQLPDDAKKVGSRSARRKKNKRRWLREKSKLEEELKQKQSVVEKVHLESTEESSEEADTSSEEAVMKDEALIVTKDKQLDDDDDDEEEEEEEAVMKDEVTTVTKDQQLDDDDVDDEVVPIEIRPGHIRFEPRSKDLDFSQTRHPVDRLQWNGITSKKKGQKWGTEKCTNRSLIGDNHHNKETCITTSSKDEVPERCILDFEKLDPYVGLPKKGDVLAYRLMELSSSWCPEVSSFRVGKISSYDSESNVIRLEPVPEYPFTTERNQDEEEDCALESDTSPYNEDGSLEVDFLSIVDPRIVRRAILEASEVATPRTIPAAKDKVARPNNVIPNTHQKSTTPTSANGAVANTWDDVIQVLSSKKLELLAKENGQEKQNSGKSSWSYRAARGSALGPLMARLREQNELEGK